MFKEKATRVANEWDEPAVRVEALRVDPGTREMFEWASVEMFARITASDALQRLRGHNVQHGMLVISRILYMYAHTAKHHEMTLDEFEEAVMDKGSYEAFEEIAGSMSNRLAKRVEHWLQLAPSRFSGDHEMMLRNFSYDPFDGHFSIKTLESVARQHIRSIHEENFDEAVDPSPKDNDLVGECKAHRAGVLLPVYRAVAKVAVTDSRLAAHILKK